MITRATLRTTLPLLFLLISATTQAASVTQYYTAQISGFKGGSWNAEIGDWVRFSATYENPSSAMHIYDNGRNGVDDGGAGDDQISEIIALGSVDNHTLYSNATIDLVDIVDRVASDRATWLDLHDKSYSQLYQFTVGSSISTRLKKQSDSYEFSADFNPLESTNGLFRYADSTTDEWATLSLRNISVEVSPVPLPAAAWLFGSALLGLGWARRRKTRAVPGSLTTA